MSNCYERQQNCDCIAFEIPWWHNLMAATSSWILLTGFLILPSAFASLKTLKNTTIEKVNDFTEKIPSWTIASLCYIIGFIGTLWLWHKN